MSASRKGISAGNLEYTYFNEEEKRRKKHHIDCIAQKVITNE